VFAADVAGKAADRTAGALSVAINVFNDPMRTTKKNNADAMIRFVHLTILVTLIVCIPFRACFAVSLSKQSSPVVDDIPLPSCVERIQCDICYVCSVRGAVYTQSYSQQSSYIVIFMCLGYFR